MKEILMSIPPAARILLFLDYDGTLVSIQQTPGRAVLSPRRRRTLEALADKMFVCIVSGRSLADVRRLVDLPNLAYIGNHGFEAAWGRQTWVHPQAKKLRPALERLLKRIEIRTKRFPRLLIEDKGVTGSIHFRRLNPALVPPLRRIVDEAISRKARDFIVTEGKRVFEIRPNIDWDKGAGIRKLRGWFPQGKIYCPIFIGDDRTDEDAFRALSRNAITIHVGGRQKTRARYRLVDVEKVWRFLQIVSEKIQT
jgi:trehalose 6-phosphate phosphatase